MKHYIAHILAVVLLPLIASAELPEDVQRLVEIREKEIRKIDNSFVTALERLKDSYTRKGDLENAVIITEMIKKVDPFEPGQEVVDDERSVVGRWLFSSGRSKDNIFAFNADGTMSGTDTTGTPVRGQWRRSGDDIILSSVKWGGGDWATIQMNAVGGPRLKTKYGNTMRGRRVED